MPDSFKPTIVLRQERFALTQGATGGAPVEHTLPCVELCFDYAGLSVPCDQQGERCYLASGSSLRAVERDLMAERSARLALESHGCVELACLPDHEPDLDSRAHYLLGAERDEQAFCAFSARGLPALVAQGWGVEIEEGYPYGQLTEATRWFAELDGPGAGAGASKQWFELALGIELAGARIDLVPVLLQMLRDASGQPTLRAIARGAVRPAFVRLPGRAWLPIDAERLRTLWGVLLELYEGLEPGEMRLPHVRLGGLSAITEIFEGEPFDFRAPEWSKAALGLTGRRGTLERRSGCTVPPVRRSLRDYQKQGVAWLQGISDAALGGLLADDMGLGKTLQVIAHLALEQANRRLGKPALVLCPTSLVEGWKLEVQRSAPQLRSLVYQGADRARLLGDLGRNHLVICSYAVLLRDQAVLSELSYSALVLDEAQAFKNPDSQLHRALRLLHAEHRVALSGTPVENRLEDLWAIFEIILPGLLGGRQRFEREQERPLSLFGDEGSSERLRRRIAPYFLRRVKQQVASELPARSVVLRPVELLGKQRELYEQIRASAHEDVRRAIREKGVPGSIMGALAGLTRLRQLCCDPQLLSMEAARFVRESAKRNLLMELLDEHLASGRRVLVFSQFARMLKLISRELATAERAHLLLTGQTRDRQSLVDDFQAGRADVFLISLKAGGAGLNLTRADTVILYEPWWNPAAEAQASDRAHRIGQSSPVLIQRLVVSGSIEEKMLELQQRKRWLADQVVRAQEAKAAPWTPRDLEQLFAPLPT